MRGDIVNGRDSTDKWNVVVQVSLFLGFELCLTDPHAGCVMTMAVVL